MARRSVDRGVWWLRGTFVALAMSMAVSSAHGEGDTLIGGTSEGAAAAEAAPATPEPTHQQVKVLTPTFGDAKLKLSAFCLTKDGKVVALMNRVEPPAPAKRRINLRLKSAPAKPADEPAPAKKSDGATGRALLKALSAVFAQPSAGTSAASSTEEERVVAEEEPVAENPPEATGGTAEIRLLDADGKLLAQGPVDFEAQAVNVDADGNVVLGGDGFVARYDLTGKQLSRADSPQMAGAAKNEKELEDRAREALQSQAASLEESLKAMEKQKEDLEGKKDEDLTDEERQTKKSIAQMLEAYKRAIENYKTPKEQQVKMMAQQLAGRARKINAIAASDKHVFVTCGDPKGFGYSVWRTDLDFQNPKQIVSGLSGCCGQMDVQCCGEELVVAENSRKRVVRYDAEGKKVASFGKGSRDGAGDTFGSCCNPMNTRLAGDKLYVSDSDGRVRLFTLDGKYEGEVGKAKVREGCKSSIVDISPDGNRVYYIDVNSSRICVLERKPLEDKQASVR